MSDHSRSRESSETTHQWRIGGRDTSTLIHYRPAINITHSLMIWDQQGALFINPKCSQTVQRQDRNFVTSICRRCRVIACS